jgi:hypothetical protein
MREIKRELSDYFPEISRNSFPYGGLGEGNRRFRGRNRFLKGYIEKTLADTNLGVDERAIFVPKGTKFLEIHFDVKQRSIEDGEMSKVLRLLQGGAEDALDLIDAIQVKPKLRNVNLIAGRTNQRMARIAVNKLGFRYATTDDLIEHSGILAKVFRDRATIFITRDELIAQKDNLEDLALTLVAYRESRPSHKRKALAK